MNLKLGLWLPFTLPQLKLSIRGIELGFYQIRIEDEKMRRIMQHAMDKVKDTIATKITESQGEHVSGAVMNAIEDGKVTFPGTHVVVKPGTETVLRNGSPMAPGSYTIDNGTGEIQSLQIVTGDNVQVSDFTPNESYEDDGPDMAAATVTPGTDHITLEDNFIIDKVVQNG